MNNELEANKKHFSKSYNQQLILLSQTAGETDHEEKVAATTDETSYELLTLQEGFLSLFHISSQNLVWILEVILLLDTPTAYVHFIVYSLQSPILLTPVEKINRLKVCHMVCTWSLQIFRLHGPLCVKW